MHEWFFSGAQVANPYNTYQVKMTLIFHKFITFAKFTYLNILFLQDIPLLKQFICPFTGKVIEPVKTGEQEFIIVTHYLC